MSNLTKILNKVFKHPLSLPYYLLSKTICHVRSIYYSHKIDEGGGKIIIKEPFIKFNINKHRSSYLYIRGDFRISKFMGGNNSTLISLSENSKMVVHSDFVIGQGVRIFLEKNATLDIGGKEKESDSGITADTLIMVFQKMTIGKDLICAWNNFLTDSDWHHIEGQSHHADVKIGDHVWIANNNNILKGSTIGDNCIIASNSKLINQSFPNDVLIGGVPPKILRSQINWKRDI